MTSRLTKAAILGFLTGIVGLGVSLLPFGLDLEENTGLGILFHLRGVRQPPSEVMVISIDKASADNLGLPDDPRKWPRQLHASLIENLTREGARVIAFDIFFEEPRSAEEDRVFSEAMRKARNVVLSGYLRSEKVPVADAGGVSTGDLTIVNLVPPSNSLEQSALGIAPFPLPKVPVRVNQYWTFKTGAGDIPTLPVVVFQIFALEEYAEFRRLMEKVSPSQAIKLPHDKNAIVAAGSIDKVIRVLKDIFDNDPSLAEQMLKELDYGGGSVERQRKERVKSLIKIYQGADSRYLNFYGPARTITTVPYSRILQPREKTNGKEQQIDIRGKAVFVGLSEIYRPEQKDGFYTVFSQPNGLDVSGVEIASTAFANLLEDIQIQPLGLRIHLVVIILWGMVIGILCRQFPAAIAALCIAGLGTAYLLVAGHAFKTTGAWYPLVIPLFIQTSFALFSSVSLKYRDSLKERERIRKAFGYYLPDGVVDRLSKDLATIKAGSELVYGICLSTDAEHYTSLSEAMEPKELSEFMNRYYETIFEPIKKHSGVVANVIGDSMLAMWVTAEPDAALKDQACLAALDICDSVRRFNQGANVLNLPTRIGLHSGDIVLGNIGAADHYEYRPVGDIVNTATRIEGLNKYLGTRILASEAVMHNLQGFPTRNVGTFLLMGKTKPIIIHELLCRADALTEQTKGACTTFAEALDAFRRRSWEEAIKKFHECINNRENDGPSQFYIKLCEEYKINPPGDSWDGVVYMDKK